MVYADILLKYEQLADDLPEAAILIDWGYEDNHPFDDECRRISKSGHEYYVCAGTSSWNSIGGRWQNACDNIKKPLKAGLVMVFPVLS